MSLYVDKRVLTEITDVHILSTHVGDCLVPRIVQMWMLATNGPAEVVAATLSAAAGREPRAASIGGLLWGRRSDCRH